MSSGAAVSDRPADLRGLAIHPRGTRRPAVPRGTIILLRQRLRRAPDPRADLQSGHAGRVVGRGTTNLSDSRGKEDLAHARSWIKIGRAHV